MNGHGRPGRVCRPLPLAVLLCLFLGLDGAGAYGQPAGSPDESCRDAELTDVYFVDPDRGWAVGDRGVIWHTADGGRHWRNQASPVPSRLESVHFLDDRNGWIVGGFTHPYTHLSSGVVLRTFDGGQRWEQVPRLSLPALHRVRFQDLRNGWAVGQTSGMYPAGVFRTTDGGRAWSSLPGATGSQWLTGDFIDGRVGALAGRGGAVVSVRESGLEGESNQVAGLRHIRCLRFVPPPSGSRQLSAVQPGWLVGDGGLVRLTLDGGRSWQEPSVQPPAGLCDQFDYRAVAVWGDCCWIAGAPGTRVLHTGDAGRTWQAFETGHTIPIRSLQFLDGQRGWAVGSLGTILATRDGGRSWTAQQSGGKRAALLGIFSEPDRVPLELLAAAAANDGYLSAIEVLHRRDLDTPAPEQATLDQRLHEAVVAAGGSQAETAWRFPLRQAGLGLSAEAAVAEWDRLDQGRGQERLEAHLVRKIRQWRPEVVVTEPSSPHGDQPLLQLDNQIVLRAVARAAEPSAFPEQLTEAGLEPWTVKKVLSSLGADVPGAVNLTLSFLAPRLGRSLADQAQRGWPLIRARLEPPPQTSGFALLVNRLPQEVGRKDLFSGISLPAGGDARRALASTQSGDVRAVTRAAQQRRNVSKLLGQVTAAAQNGAAWLAQIEDLTRGLDDTASGEVLFEMAESTLRTGDLQLAADIQDVLVKRYPQHPFCEPALVWLVHYYASGEAPAVTSTSPAPPAPSRKAHAAPGPAAKSGVQPARFEVPVAGPAAASGPVPGPGTKPLNALRPSPQERVRRAIAYAELVQNGWPSLALEPAFCFPLASAYRTADQPADAERIYRALVGHRVHDAWWDAARGEIWLLRPSRRGPRPVATCPRTSTKPRLDGRLDDEAWTNCLPVSLSSERHDDAAWPAAVMFAHDAEFLYLAVNCRRGTKSAGESNPLPRPRDPDLSEHDRVDVLLDRDRDYASYCRLTVDHRGWAQDACLGCSAWNPTWFIAAQDDGQTWTIEAAIPWHELGGGPPEKQQVWAVGIQRTIPGVGFQSWTKPAAIRVQPQGFALLSFGISRQLIPPGSGGLSVGEWQAAIPSVATVARRWAAAGFR